MNTSSEKLNLGRRQIVGAAVVTAAAARLGMFSVVAALCSFIAPGHAQAPSQQERKADIGFFEIDKDITLRRMVVRNPRPKGGVLFLHGFPVSSRLDSNRGTCRP